MQAVLVAMTHLLVLGQTLAAALVWHACSEAIFGLVPISLLNFALCAFSHWRPMLFKAGFLLDIPQYVLAVFSALPSQDHMDLGQLHQFPICHHPHLLDVFCFNLLQNRCILAGMVQFG